MKLGIIRATCCPLGEQVVSLFHQSQLISSAMNLSTLSLHARPQTNRVNIKTVAYKKRTNTFSVARWQMEMAMNAKTVEFSVLPSIVLVNYETGEERTFLYYRPCMVAGVIDKILFACDEMTLEILY